MRSADGHERPLPNLVEHGHLGCAGVPTHQARNLGLESPGGRLCRRARSRCAPDHPRDARYVRDPLRLGRDHGDAQLLDPLEVSRPVAALPREHQIRLQPENLFEIDSGSARHDRKAFCLGRIVAEIRHADDGWSAAGCERKLGEVWREGDDAMRWTVEPHDDTSVVGERNRSRQESSRCNQQQGQEGASQSWRSATGRNGHGQRKTAGYSPGRG